MKTEKSKSTAVLWCFIAYAVAGIAAYLAAGTVWWGSRHPLVLALVADIVGTVVIFIFSVIFNNSSFYDPYWSVAPAGIALVIILHPMSSGGGDLRTVILFALIVIWGVRLTANFLMGWSGVEHEDWRYRNFREDHGRRYWLVSFLGVHMFPTLIVFAGCLSMFPAFTMPVHPFRALDVFGAAVIVAALSFETGADVQLKRFLKKDAEEPSDLLTDGLWKYSRHPNYFGEILFWWGVYLFGLSANPVYWWTFAGPLAITLMFRFISVPLIEKHMKRKRPHYADQRKGVPYILPWFVRND